MNKPLCTYPWAHLDIETNGDIKYCCASLYAPDDVANIDENGNHYNILTHTIDDAWNSKRILKLRENLYNGVKAPECRMCWEQEEKGVTSVRSSALASESSYPDIQEIVNKSAINGFRVETKPKYYQIQAGNLCNLSCKMCHSDYSTTYGEFYYPLYPEDVNANKYNDLNYHSHHGTIRSEKPNVYDWPKRIGLKNILTGELLEDITRLYLSGGEPTIIKENLDFIQYLVDNNYSNNIDLVITTNATKIHHSFYENIKYFNTSAIMLSIDGVYPYIELQRYPAKWNIIESNILKYIDLSIETDHKVCAAFNTVLGALTIVGFDKLIEFIANCYEEKQYFVDMHIQTLYYGDFGLHIVPQEILKEFGKKIENTYLKYKDCLNELTSNSIINLLKYIEGSYYNKENNYKEIQNALSILQKHHPEYNIKEIYSDYY